MYYNSRVNTWIADPQAQNCLRLTRFYNSCIISEFPPGTFYTRELSFRENNRLLLQVHWNLACCRKLIIRNISQAQMLYKSLYLIKKHLTTHVQLNLWGEGIILILVSFITVHFYFMESWYRHMRHICMTCHVDDEIITVMLTHLKLMQKIKNEEPPICFCFYIYNDTSAETLYFCIGTKHTSSEDRAHSWSFVVLFYHQNP